MAHDSAVRVAGISLHCGDAQQLGEFYLALHGAGSQGSSAGIEVAGLTLVMQRVAGSAPPRWPGSAIVHLNLTADDIDAAMARAVSLGATVAGQPDPRWRVLLNPAGHPFCLTPSTPRVRPRACSACLSTKADGASLSNHEVSSKQVRSGVAPVYPSMQQYRASTPLWQRLLQKRMIKRVEAGQARLRRAAAEE